MWAKLTGLVEIEWNLRAMLFEMERRNISLIARRTAKILETENDTHNLDEGFLNVPNTGTSMESGSLNIRPVAAFPTRIHFVRIWEVDLLGRRKA